MLIASFSTIRGGRFEDHTCVIEPGLHHKVPNRSFIYYAKAQTYTENFLRSYSSPQGVACDELLNKVLDGAEVSDFLLQDYRQLLIDQGIL